MEHGDTDIGDHGDEIGGVDPTGAGLGQPSTDQSSEPSLSDERVIDRALGGDRGGLITARGTIEGLMLRVDGRVEVQALRAALKEFVKTRSGFLSGQEVTLEWVGARPESTVEREILSALEEEHGIVVKSSRAATLGSGSTSGVQVARDASSRDFGFRDSGAIEPAAPRYGRAPSLFDGSKDRSGTRADVFGKTGQRAAAGGGSAAGRASPSLQVTRGAGFRGGAIGAERGGGLFSGAPVDSLAFDEPDGRIIYGTLRSGQKVESEHSVVIIGDVNSGAEVVSGGDIIVLGTLRGIAHAGAYEENGGGRVIFALNLLPTQLRIGSIISRGSAEGGAQAEMARVEGTLIVVEPYQARGFTARGNLARG